MLVSVVHEEFENMDISLDSFKEEIKNDFKDKYGDYAFAHIVTSSPKMNSILEVTKKYAKSDITILILGESGTGKSMLAKYIHDNSNRKYGPYLSLNCASIPENLLESELFGYAPYAFSGASPKGKVGLIELANTGTLFLDEIGELSLHLQAKLLDVIENKQFIPVGSKELKKIDVRLISATNKDLEKMVREKQFREDLYWRLNMIDITIPPLRERKEDVLPLTTYFLNIFNKKYKTDKFLSDDVINAFTEYNWAGNVRQLKNIVERAIVVSNKPRIELIDIPSLILNEIKRQSEDEKKDFDEKIEEFQRSLIIEAYEIYKTSRKVAEALDISQSTANRLISKYCRND